MQNKECKYIVTNSPAIEAAIVINGKGEALSWYSKKNSPIDEVAAISNNLVTIAHELCLFDTASVASMILKPVLVPSILELSILTGSLYSVLLKGIHF